MKIAILLILLVPILLMSLGFGILMAYGLYEFLLKIIDPG